MKYILNILRHKWFVIRAGIRIKGISLWRLLLHDLSKFSPIEFKAYKKKFFYKNCPKDEWDRAWLHHVHKNPHHWQHWVLKDRPLIMDETYIREMVADWFAAERSYKGSWDIQNWLSKKYPNMKLHPETRRILKTILREQKIYLPS